MNAPSAALEWPVDEVLLPALLTWARQRRWFPLKGGALADDAVLHVVADIDLAPGVRDLVVAVPRAAGPDGAGGAAPLCLHVPLVLAPAQDLPGLTAPAEQPGAGGFLLPDGSAAVADGPHHPAFWRAWAQAARRAGTVLDEAAVQAIIQRAERLRVTTGEQSNTSVILPAPTGQAPGETGSSPTAHPPREPEDAATGDLIVKVFRVLAAGRNPDVEVSVALARQGWDRVRTPVAWSALTFVDPVTGQEALTDSAVATTFIPRADDGFELFCALARQDDGPGAVVRDRARRLAAELGRTTAQMHHHLAQSLGTSDPQEPGELARALGRRADWALAEVPELAERAPGVRQGVDAVLLALERLPRLPRATRIHGDYHLGQTLHETGGPQRWFVMDFEGEPLRPLSERSLPDQPVRDVAGMLRSFGYAAAVSRIEDPSWLEQMRASFLDGYASAAPSTSAEDRAAAAVLTSALELDKALYEAVYEARNRPGWLAIPLAGITQVISANSPTPDSTHGRVTT